jgi:hypothetical protein
LTADALIWFNAEIAMSVICINLPGILYPAQLVHSCMVRAIFVARVRVLGPHGDRGARHCSQNEECDDDSGGVVMDARGHEGSIPLGSCETIICFSPTESTVHPDRTCENIEHAGDNGIRVVRDVEVV